MGLLPSPLVAQAIALANCAEAHRDDRRIDEETPTKEQVHYMHCAVATELHDDNRYKARAISDYPKDEPPNKIKAEANAAKDWQPSKKGTEREGNRYCTQNRIRRRVETWYVCSMWLTICRM